MPEKNWLSLVAVHSDIWLLSVAFYFGARFGFGKNDSLRDYEDALIDITRESSDITISRCHFYQHDKTILIGADASHTDDRCMRITIHHCFFDGTRQRHPRVRFAKVHLYNNYT